MMIVADLGYFHSTTIRVLVPWSHMEHCSLKEQFYLAILINFQSIKEGTSDCAMFWHNKKTNLKCQALIDNILASIAMLTADRMAATVDDDESPHGLVYDVSSVESTGCLSTGYSINDEDDVRTAETLNDVTEDVYSSVDEKDSWIAWANKKTKF